MRTPHDRSCGFTMLELLVVTAATSLMLLLLNNVTASMTSAVRLGQATSLAITHARTIDDQLRRDAAAMVGPRQGGVLVLLQREVNAPLAVDDAMERPFRADQLFWVADAREIEPIAPGHKSALSNSTDAKLARIWYGQLLRTDPDGSGPADPDGSGPAVADLGSPGPNRLAGSWLLGRQALYLADSFRGFVHANGGWFDAPVVGYGTPGGRGAPPFSGGTGNRRNDNGPLYMATTDIAYFGLTREARSTGNRSSGYDRGAMTTDTLPPHGQPNPNGVTRNPRVERPRLEANLPADEYRQRAYLYAYGHERLRVNPSPVKDRNGDGDYSDTLESWQVVQMHPLLASHVCSFAVDFAGDYDGDGQLDRDVDDLDNDGDRSELRWYGRFAEAGMPVGPPGFAGFDRPGAAAGSRPIYDEQPALNNRFGSVAHADGGFVFRHGGSDAVNWPKLLRFRYRLVDAAGNLIGGDGLPGRQFEQIVRIDPENFGA